MSTRDQRRAAKLEKRKASKAARVERRWAERQAQGLAALLAFGCNCVGFTSLADTPRQHERGEALHWAQMHTAHFMALLRLSRTRGPTLRAVGT